MREFAESKQRLSKVLTGALRAELTLAMLSKVLRELEYSLVDQIIVVAADQKEIRQVLPRQCKVEVVEESIHHGGVNLAMRDGLKLIPQSREMGTFLIPSDLPLITSQAVDRATSLLKDYDLIINPSSKMNGTNLLGFRATIPIDLYYDNDSVTNHVAAAQRSNLHYLAIDWKEFSTDLDDSDDLNTVMKLLGVNSFENLIAKLKDSRS